MVIKVLDEDGLTWIVTQLKMKFFQKYLLSESKDCTMNVLSHIQNSSWSIPELLKCFEDRK